MARFFLDDPLIARLVVRSSPHPHELIELDWRADPVCRWERPGDLPGVGAVFRFATWPIVREFAACCAQRRDWIFNSIGVRFAANRDRADAAFAAVLVSDYRDDAELSDRAVDALCVEAFKTKRALAPQPIRTAPWWPALCTAMDIVATRSDAQSAHR